MVVRQISMIRLGLVSFLRRERIALDLFLPFRATAVVVLIVESRVRVEFEFDDMEMFRC